MLLQRHLITPASLLWSHSQSLTLPQFLQIHALLITHPPPIHPHTLALHLIHVSSSLSVPHHSILVFLSLPPAHPPSLLLFNSLLKSLAHHRLFSLALRFFNRLLLRHRPDEFTFTAVLKSCAALLSPRDADIAHALVIKHAVESNLFVKNSLVDMHFKLGNLDVARRLFDEMPVRDVVSYNTLIAGYSSCGEVGLAREVFDSMTMRTVVSWSAMIAGYAKAGDVAAAWELFDEMPERNVVCWNAMIAGYAQNERFKDAVELFRRMLMDGVRPNEVTLVSVLSACANLGALELGSWIDKYVRWRRMRLGLFLGNALSDMYAKCGCIADARRVFDEMTERDVISWSIIVTGTARHGLWAEAIAAFREMLKQGMKPNDVTFMGLLSACTHAGLVDEGLEYFDRMVCEFGIERKVEHYGCVVDMLSRSGRLDEAEDLISSMKVAPNAIVWGALLGGCRIHHDIDRGKRVAHRILELDPGHSGSYIYLANVYASTGELEAAAKYRLKMREKRVEKTPGCSWIEVDNTVHEFFMGDRSHARSVEIYAMMRSLWPRMKLAGYIPDTSVVSQTISEEEKEGALATHSEKLAVAFGLISTPEGSTIRVVKNLRVCNDCHDYMKVVSRVVGREIVLRDRSRFHHFSGGLCSCRDYW